MSTKTATNEEASSYKTLRENSTSINDSMDDDVKLSLKPNDDDGNVYEYFTLYGTQRVTVNGDLSSDKPIIITYHDIGVNHKMCFGSFFNTLTNNETIYKYCTIIHIDCPGHHENAKTTSDKIESFDIEELSNGIEYIREKLNINKPFIAVGLGAGCSVWSYYAANYSFRIRGLILINPVCSENTWSELIAEYAIKYFTTKNSWIQSSLYSSLCSRYFPRGTKKNANVKELVGYFYKSIKSMNKENVVKYFRGFLKRQELTEDLLSKINCYTLVIAGYNASTYKDSILYQRKLNKRLTTFVNLDYSGFLLTVTEPQKIIGPITLFLNTLGITLLSMQSKYKKQIKQ